MVPNSKFTLSASSLCVVLISNVSDMELTRQNEGDSPTWVSRGRVLSALRESSCISAFLLVVAWLYCVHFSERAQLPSSKGDVQSGKFWAAAVRVGGVSPEEGVVGSVVGIFRDMSCLVRPAAMTQLAINLSATTLVHTVCDCKALVAMSSCIAAQ